MRSPEYEPLSTRQAEIAGLIARGKSTREIADALHLSSRTVEGHVTAIFNKMGVRSRVELAAALLTTLPPRPVGVAPNNLPRKLTSFIGRETEIAAIGALVESQQLVTVVGSAGVGKTSTSLQVAANVLTQFSDGVWFIELAPLMDGEYIPATVARVLSLRLSVEGDQLASLVMQLKAKRALLIFDNCEHLIDP
ncbi:MAG: ATPase, partial [Candidatus Eremiobacteraeota bacterium]|nr:ATPase [Candidatus Eremiobacteraeota bacterium]